MTTHGAKCRYRTQCERKQARLSAMRTRGNLYTVQHVLPGGPGDVPGQEVLTASQPAVVSLICGGHFPRYVSAVFRSNSDPGRLRGGAPRHGDFVCGRRYGNVPRHPMNDPGFWMTVETMGVHGCGRSTMRMHEPCRSICGMLMNCCIGEGLSAASPWDPRSPKTLVPIAYGCFASERTNTRAD